MPSGAPRRLLPSACLAVALLAAVLGVSAAGLAANLGLGWPGRWIGLWADCTAAAGVFFLRWLTRARFIAERHAGPGWFRASPGWAVGAWLVPVASLWVPAQAVADIIRASRGPVPGRPRPGQDVPGLRLLRAWWALWLSMWLAFCGFTVSYLVANDRGWGVTAAQRVLDLAFELLSLAAAGCAVALVVTMTRQLAGLARPGQPGRPAGPARIVPVGWVALGLVPVAVLGGLTVLRPAIGGTLAPAGVTLSRAEAAGQWRAADGGLLVLSPSGRFTARRLSIDLATGTAAGRAGWTGTGTWQPAGPGGGPWLSLTAGGDPGLGFTVGGRASPTMLLKMGEFAVNADDGDEHDYYVFRKQR